MLLALEPDKNNDHLLVDPLFYFFVCLQSLLFVVRRRRYCCCLLCSFLVRHEFVFSFYLLEMELTKGKKKRRNHGMPVNRSRCIM